MHTAASRVGALDIGAVADGDMLDEIAKADVIYNLELMKSKLIRMHSLFIKEVTVTVRPIMQILFFLLLLTQKKADCLLIPKAALNYVIERILHLVKLKKTGQSSELFQVNLAIVYPLITWLN